MSDINDLTPEERDELLKKVEYLDCDETWTIEYPLPQKAPEPVYYSKDSTIPLDGGLGWVKKHWPNATPEAQATILRLQQDKRTREVVERNQPKISTDALVYDLFRKIPESTSWTTRQIGEFIGRSHKSVSLTKAFKAQSGINEQVKREAADSAREGKPKPPTD